mmetsp:Transcript_52295/g.124759  ORF Transcript_52295/g.124759 Transcript_52295/m.124759 type:complete len:224 (+) Transcript_52295:168-839(+)
MSWSKSRAKTCCGKSLGSATTLPPSMVARRIRSWWRIGPTWRRWISPSWWWWIGVWWRIRVWWGISSWWRTWWRSWWWRISVWWWVRSLEACRCRCHGRHGWRWPVVRQVLGSLLWAHHPLPSHSGGQRVGWTSCHPRCRWWRRRRAALKTGRSRHGRWHRWWWCSLKCGCGSHRWWWRRGWRRRSALESRRSCCGVATTITATITAITRSSRHWWSIACIIR